MRIATPLEIKLLMPRDLLPPPGDTLQLFGEHANYPGRFAEAVMQQLLTRLAYAAAQAPERSAVELITHAQAELQARQRPPAPARAY